MSLLSADELTVRSHFIGTSNLGFAQRAQEEIRRLIPETTFFFLLPMEVFFMTLPCSSDEAVELIKDKEPIFLRHIQPVTMQIHSNNTIQDVEFIKEHIAIQPIFQPGQKVAIQIRKSPSTSLTYALSDMRDSLDMTLTEKYHIETVTRFADLILSIFIHDDMIYCGISIPAHNLSDWSGGAIRFKKEDNQVSRAKFKLLEAESAFNLDFATFRCALDVGAAPRRMDIVVAGTRPVGNCH